MGNGSICRATTWAVAAIGATVFVLIPPRALGQAPTAEDCHAVSADTRDKTQLEAVVRICSMVLGRSDVDSGRRGGMLVHRGVAHRNLGVLDRALTDHLEARRLLPEDASTARMLGWTYREMRRSEEAEREFGRSLRLEPHWQGFLSRCYVRFDLKRYNDALADCKTAHQINPNGDSTYLIALLYRQRGEAGAAISILEAAIGTSMASARIYRLLSEAYAETGRAAEAQAIRERGRRRFPHDPQLRGAEAE